QSPASLWRQDVGQDIRHMPDRLRLEQRPPVDLAGLLLDTIAQTYRRSTIGKRGIALHQILEGDTDTTKPDRQARHLMRRQNGANIRPAKPRHQPRWSHDIQQPHGRHVERQLKRLTDGDITLVSHVEILRAVAGKIGRPVLYDRFLGDETLLEGKAVDEWL